MRRFLSARVGLVAMVGMLMACAASKKETAQAPSSDDLLELLTGFGESLSKRNFTKAVDYMVPEEKALMMEGSSVPPEKQKMLMALPLQRLIRHPAIRVQNGKIAGIYTVLPNLNQAQAGSMPAEDTETPAADVSESPATEAPAGSDYADMSSSEDGEEPQATVATGNDPQLKATVNKFFTAVNRRNWQGALALMNDSERKLLLDDKGRLKESAKKRLTQIDQTNREALVLQDGKLTGVTLLLPSDNN
jgi:hypothetical protein